MAQRKRCCCEKPGALYSGIPGIVASPADKMGRRCIERCDACERFYCDEAAGLHYARVRGGDCSYEADDRVVWIPHDRCPSNRIARQEPMG